MKNEETVWGDVSKLKENIVLWLQQFLESSEKAGYVIGVSGGIDSAVCSLLANEACERAGTRAFVPICLPISIGGIQDGRDMRAFFLDRGIRAEFYDLTEAYEAFMRVLPEDEDPFTIATIKHRIRMNFVYTYAKRHDLLVVSTVNGIEFATGYFPKHAGLGDVLPQADLRKCEIRAIAKLYGLPTELTMRKASGCIHGNTAEDEWGFTEDDGDAMVEGLLREDSDALDLPDQKVRRFNAMRGDTHHKRTFPAVFRREDV